MPMLLLMLAFGLALAALKQRTPAG